MELVMGEIPPLVTVQALVILVETTPGRVSPWPMPAQLVFVWFSVHDPDVVPVAATDPVKLVPMAVAWMPPVTISISSLERLLTVTV